MCNKESITPIIIQISFDCSTSILFALYTTKRTEEVTARVLLIDMLDAVLLRA